MHFLYKLERRFGKFAIPQLMRKVLFGQAIIFLMTMLTRNFLIFDLFTFDVERILQGQIWRLVTFIFIPNSFSLFYFLLFVLVYMSIADSLEHTWGTFNFNVYYLVSMVAVILVGFVLYFFQMPMTITAQYIHLSLFLALATLIPDATFSLYFFIPVKAKYLTIFYFIILSLDVVAYGFRAFALITASLLGYILFLGIPALRKQGVRHQARPAQKQFKQYQKEQAQAAREPLRVAFHKCHVCGMTELDNPEMEFRYCSKCNGHYEYCMDHLRDHTHIE